MRIAILAAMLCAPQCALAHEWKVFNVEQGVVNSLDTDSIVATSNGNKTAWSKVEYPPHHKTGLIKFVELIEYDCQQNRSRDIQLVFYRPNGSIRQAGLEAWDYAVPDTISEGRLNIVCGR